MSNFSSEMKDEIENDTKLKDPASSFDSSDDEQGDIDLSPLVISWLDLSGVGCDEPLGICALPGCRFKDTWRSLENDIKCLVSEGVKELFCLCSKGELNKYRVPKLLQELTVVDINVHHTPFPDGLIPSTSVLVKMVEDLRVLLMNGRKTVIHCYGGLGRSCFLAAALMMKLDCTLDADKAIETLRQLRGPSAVQSVKQYNCLHDLRQQIEDYEHKESEEAKRSLSR